MLYVVDSPQALHFKTLFAQARRWGYDRVELEHISFGSVLGKDGKPLKTRKGGAIGTRRRCSTRPSNSALAKYEASYAERARRSGTTVPELTDDGEG